MNLTSSSCPFELKSAWITGVVLWESKLFAFIADLSSAREWSFLISSSIPRFKSDKIILIESLANSDSAIPIDSWMQNLPLNEVSASRSCDVMCEPFVRVAAWLVIDERGVRVSPCFRFDHQNLRSPDLLLALLLLFLGCLGLVRFLLRVFVWIQGWILCGIVVWSWDLLLDVAWDCCIWSGTSLSLSNSLRSSISSLGIFIGWILVLGWSLGWELVLWRRSSCRGWWCICWRWWCSTFIASAGSSSGRVPWCTKRTTLINRSITISCTSAFLTLWLHDSRVISGSGDLNQAQLT